MDNIAHTLLGVTLANAGLSKRWGRGTTATLVIASNLPDVDALWAMTQSPGAFLMRRMLTHSIVGVPLLALAAAWLLKFRYKNLSWKTLIGLTLLGLAGHLFYDLLNSYGVVLLYPFSHHRFELAWVFIVDLFFWGIPLAPFLLLIPLKRWISLERLSQIALGALGLYIGLCGWGRLQGERLLEQTIQREKWTPGFTYVFPEALGCHRFRGLVKENETYRMVLLHVFQHRADVKMVVTTDETNPAVEAVKQTPFIQKLLWFAKAPVWHVEYAPTSENSPRQPSIREIQLYDLRFNSLVLNRGGRHFIFRFDSQGNQLPS